MDDALGGERQGERATERRRDEETSPGRPVAQSPSRSFIERVIEASARNKFLVFIFAIFAVVAGIYALIHTPLDAIPDLSDAQVIVYTEWEGRSPDLVEDQVTYPISTAFIAAPNVAEMAVFTATAAAPFTGIVETTVGGAAVVRVHTKFAARAAPAGFFAPVVIVAVYKVLLTRATAGVNVAVTPA